MLTRNTHQALRKRWQDWEVAQSSPSNPPAADKLQPPQPTQPSAASSPTSASRQLRVHGACEWATQELRLLAHLGTIDDKFLLPLGALNKYASFSSPNPNPRFFVPSMRCF
jgi:hypothetical protein